MGADQSGGSVAFDQAAAIYDATRTLSEQARRAVTEILRGEIAGRGRVLEIGVGTGRIALPLHELDVQLAGIDLSLPMLRKLLEKTEGRPPFPLAQGDATRLPFASAAFGAAYGVHVLHLIPAWREVVSELVRVVRPGGVVLIDLGGLAPEIEELQDRFAEAAGASSRHPGLGFDGGPELDAEFERLGASLRLLDPVVEEWRLPPGDFVQLFEAGVFSWTWPIPPEDRRRAGQAILPWLEERFGSLQEPHPFERGIHWRAYELP